MLRLLIRAIGLLLLAGGCAALVVDGTGSIAGGGLYVTSTAEALLAIAPGVFRFAEAAGHALVPSVRDRLQAGAHAVPASLALGSAGLLLVLVSHVRFRAFWA